MDPGLANLIYLLDAYTTPDQRQAYLTSVGRLPSSRSSVVVMALLEQPLQGNPGPLYRQLLTRGGQVSFQLDPSFLLGLTPDQHYALENLMGHRELVGLRIDLDTIVRNPTLISSILPPVSEVFELRPNVVTTIFEALRPGPLPAPDQIALILHTYLQLKYQYHYQQGRLNLAQVVANAIEPRRLLTYLDQIRATLRDDPAQAVTDALISRAQNHLSIGQRGEIVERLYGDPGSLNLDLGSDLLDRLDRTALARALGVDELDGLSLRLEEVSYETLLLLEEGMPILTPPNFIQPARSSRINYCGNLTGFPTDDMDLVDVFLSVYLSNRFRRLVIQERTRPVPLGPSPDITNFNLVITRYVPPNVIMFYLGLFPHDARSVGQILIEDPEKSRPEYQSLVVGLFHPNIQIALTQTMIDRASYRDLSHLWRAITLNQSVPGESTLRTRLLGAAIHGSTLGVTEMEILYQLIDRPLPSVVAFTTVLFREQLVSHLNPTLPQGSDFASVQWLNGYLALMLERLDQPTTITRLILPSPQPARRIRPRRPQVRDLVDSITSYLEHLITPSLRPITIITDPDNPYEYISTQDLIAMAENRNIDVGITREELVVGLRDYDRINPEYLNRAQTINRFSSRETIILFAGLHKVDVRTQVFGNNRLLRLALVAVTLPPWTGFRVVEPEPVERQDLDVQGHASQVFYALRNIVPLHETPATSDWYQLARYGTGPTPLSTIVTIMEASRDDRRAIFRIWADVTLADLLPDEAIFIGLLHGWAPRSMQPTPSTLERYRLLQRRTPEVREILDRIYAHQYQIDPVDAAITAIRNRWPVSPLEAYAVEDWRRVMVNLQIVPPIGADAEMYVRDNLAYYNWVVVRGSTVPVLTLEQVAAPEQRDAYLHQLTDREILDLTGAHIGYLSRPNLVMGMAEALTTPRFFLPIRRNCLTRTTVSGDDTTDPEILIVAYGTLIRYGCYTLEELLDSFAPTDRSRSFVFGNPADPSHPFTPEAVRLLRSTIEGLPAWQPLQERIEQGLALARPIPPVDQFILEYYERAASDPDRRRMVRDYLHLLFETAMYMRRWEGPGCPYPLQQQQTERRIDPILRSSEGLTNLRLLYESMPPDLQGFIQSLPLIQRSFVERQIQPSELPLLRMVDEVYRGNYCIRLASQPLALTGWYYLRLFFDEDINDFDPDLLDEIA